MFIPDKKILRNYALVIVDFALNRGKGIKEKEIVYLQFDYPALPLALEAYQRILECGAYPILKINDDSFAKIFYKVAKNHQLEFFPKNYHRALVDTIDHRIYLMADRNPLYLKNVSSEKIIRSQKPLQQLKSWLFEKEDQRKLTWTICLYGTPGMAKQANLTVADYWQQIIRGCYLDVSDPISRWRSVFQNIDIIRNKLNSLAIDKIHLLAKNTDLWLKLGEKRQFIGGRGSNIPSFEIFTSPDWRGAEGKIYFDFPLYRYGNLIEGIYLEFVEGRVVKSKAGKNDSLLKQLIKQKNADKVGEFSLTDKRFSRIDKFMANTLFDENFGGQFGNSHLALGSSYHDCYQGEIKTVTKNQWQQLGFNDSVEHTDMIATTNRQVEVILQNGIKRCIYNNGEFII